MRKILFVANVAKEHIKKFHLPTIKLFKEYGWQVDVICKVDTDITECDNLYHAKWKRSPFSFKTILGIRQLRRLIKEVHYDVIYCHTPVGGFIGRIAASKARKAGTKVVYCAHGFHFCKEASLVNWLFYPVEKYLAKKTDLLFLINKDDFDIAIRHFNHKLIVKQIPGIGINFKRLHLENKEDLRNKYRAELGIDKDDVLLIYVAELLKNKNQSYLFSVLQQLSLSGKSVKLLLVGPDHSNGHFNKLAKKMGIDEKVIFTGWRNDIGELLNASDIYVASSIREGFGINLVEAMYCGLPVVAVNNRGHRAIIRNGENGFLVSLTEPSEMAATILRILEDGSLRKRLTEIDVKAYDCNLVAEKIYDTIESLFTK